MVAQCLAPTLQVTALELFVGEDDTVVKPKASLLWVMG